MERFPGADSSTLTIPRAQKLNVGAYHCTVSNSAGRETSGLATLTLGELSLYALLCERVWQLVK